MGQGIPLTDEQKRVIREVWVATNNATQAARAAGCSQTAALAIVREEREQLLAERAQKNGTNLLAEAFRFAAFVLIGEALQPHKLAAGSTKDLMTAAGIAIDKAQLLSGEPTARTESVTGDPRGILTREEMEQAARIRAKLAAGG